MNVLALEASTHTLSAAICTDCDTASPTLHAVAEQAPRAAAETLLGLVDDLGRQSGCRPSDLDVIAVDGGPGMFTGVRMALSTAQGIATGLGRPVVTVSALAALALTAAMRGRTDPTARLTAGRYVCLGDARKGELYLGVYEIGPGAAREAELAERVQDSLVAPADLERRFEAAPGAPWFAVGAGVAAYRETLDPTFARLGIQPLDDCTAPGAAAVALLGSRAHANGLSGSASDALPTYLRGALD